ncbi:PQQ-dependent sugar dehydrogenase [Actinopolyspora mortivallis]|uniref:PQQ-dependent sugar dehydrogenase n=1 Tax=Actinopolyspora mortivallis TaxID=33906 RepID=UPI001FDFED85|nr:PQQ-dependent sugar dehydrogenase [Actinopolyspora mortivallis]
MVLHSGNREPRGRVPGRYAVAGAVLTALALVGGCADFPEQHPRSWREQPSLRPQAGPEPRVEGEEQEPPSGERPRSRPEQPPEGCTDPDPAVVATCLAPVGAVAALPGGNSALVGERTTGRVLRVHTGRPTEEITRIPVDPTGGGGLTGLSLSPSYAEDGLVYAYVTTETDNRVVRIAPGDPPEAVLTGIPRGPSGNGGAITVGGRDSLIVATGDAGSPERASDPENLAGKLLRIDSFGEPTEDNPSPDSPVVSTGLTTPEGVCAAERGTAFWVTDRGSDREILHRLVPGEETGPPAWSWRDNPGISDCATVGASLVVTLSGQQAVSTMRPGPEGTFTGEPQRGLEDTYGRFSAAAGGPDGMLWLGTSNRNGGDPVSSDDRVIRVEPPSGGGGGKE